jgi:membrane protease YdiL (CAAX protease family)
LLLLPVLALVLGSSVLSRTARAEPLPTNQPASVTAPVDAATLAQAASLDPTQRLAATTALARSGTFASTNLLVVMLQRDVDPRVREAAAVALGSSGNADLIPTLEMAVAFDPDPAVRGAAAAAARSLAPLGRRPKFAAGLSLLCPGCGYFYLREPGRAVTYLGATAALIAAGLEVQRRSPTDGTGTHAQGRALPLYMAAQNLWFFGIYATYRDARLARGDVDARYPVPRDQLPDLLLAPFNPRVLKSPYVWAGVPLMLGAAVGFSYLVSPLISTDRQPNMRTLGDPGGVTFFGRRYGTGTGFALGEGYNLSVMLPVAVGEEALFRGVVQAGLSETSLGLWGGWALGSVIFGGIHVFNFLGDDNGFQIAAVAVPYLVVTGSYLGYVFIRKNFSLLTGVAIHFWYDFALSTVDFIADPDHQPFVARFAIPF